MAVTTILELCAGVGMLGEGLAAGLRHIGRAPRVVGYVERDAYAASVLMARMASKALEPAPVWAGNLEDVRWERWAGAVDCLVAGFPCQPHSHAGSRKGTDDARWIWPAIADCIRVVRPGLVWLENVAGLRSSGGMAPVLADLAALGFRVEWDSVRASDVGASHQRERVFILAHAVCDGRNAWRAEQPGREQRGTDTDGAGRAIQLGHASRQRLGEARDCGGAQHAGTGEYGAELADSERIGGERRGISGDVARQSGEAEGEARQRQWGRNAADDSCSLVADTGRPRLQGRQQRAAHEPDGSTGIMPTSYRIS